MAVSVSKHLHELEMRDANFVQGMGRAEQATLRFQQAQGMAASASQARSKAASRFGVVAQQAGYQVQDFAVQVQGGQSALVALGQQGSQLLGVFGVGGAIAGAVLTVATLGIRMMGVGDNTKKATEEAKKLAEQLDRIRDLKLETARDGLSPGDLNQAIIADKQIAEEAYKRQRDIVSDLEQKISAQSEKALIEKGISQTREATGPITPINNLKKNLATEKKLLLDLEEAYEKARQPAEKAKREINDSINKETERVENQRRESLRKQIEEGNALYMQEENMKRERRRAADAIKDKQDPMRAIEREAKAIGDLRRADLLTPEQAARAADDLIKSPEIPSALRTSAGASSLGGTAVNGSQVMDVARSTLEEIKKLVEESRKQTRMWALN